ncbi:hypothetical protein PUN28_018145 [Cardiocondyla obscurior]|uniref:Uncharacterized protein n=1 Tax=Cardiocondyla obscurior TaxID=286306 RepID=A0AAW2EH28_9HYME
MNDSDSIAAEFILTTRHILRAGKGRLQNESWRFRGIRATRLGPVRSNGTSRLQPNAYTHAYDIRRGCRRLLVVLQRSKLPPRRAVMMLTIRW